MTDFSCFWRWRCRIAPSRNHARMARSWRPLEVLLHDALRPALRLQSCARRSELGSNARAPALPGRRDRCQDAIEQAHSRKRGDKARAWTGARAHITQGIAATPRRRSISKYTPQRFTPSNCRSESPMLQLSENKSEKRVGAKERAGTHGTGGRAAPARAASRR
eukprot:3221171-Pleurochrysis_carterae.AAC.1